MDGTNSTTAWTIAGVVALAVIIGGGWLMSREKKSATSDTATSTEKVADVTTGSKADASDAVVKPVGGQTVPVPTPSVVAGGETITVDDQPAGSMVKIADIKLTKPSWVAIMGTDKWVRGAAWFNESRTNVEVELLKPTIAGETYQAVIYVDDGDKKFELHDNDTLVTSAEGAPVSSTFKAQ